MRIPVYRTASTMQFARWLLVTVFTLSPLPCAHAGDVITGIKARGTLRCGVSEGIPGFSEQDKSGRWIGLDADFCRAVAALLGVCLMMALGLLGGDDLVEAMKTAGGPLALLFGGMVVAHVLGKTGIAAKKRKR